MARLVVVLLLLPLAVIAGTCLDGSTSMISGSNLVVEINGPKATIYPPLPSGQPDRKAFSLGLEVTMVTERIRGPLNGDPNQPTSQICNTPLNSFRDSSVTALSDYYLGSKCGDLVKYIDLSEFDCSTRSFKTYPSAGVEVETVELSMTQEGSPFTFVALFELPNANATKATYSNTTYTNGTAYSTYYRDDYLKISWDLHGWDWNRTHETGTFATTYIQITMDIAQGYVSMRQDGHWTTMSWTSPEGDRGVSFEIESAYVIDGVPYVRQASETGSIVSAENVYFDSHTVLSFLAGTRICEKNLYWSNISIDPFIGMFSVGTPAGKRTAAYVIALPVVFGVVIIAAAIIVIAAIISPTVRRFFRPFARQPLDPHRNGLLSVETAPSAPATPQWTKPVKPDEI